MTEWSNLQWLLTGASIVTAATSIGWNVYQARRLDRLERLEAEVVDQALQLVDQLAGEVKGGAREWYRFVPVKRELREAALLAQRWGALNARWEDSELQARPVSQLTDSPPEEAG